MVFQVAHRKSPLATNAPNTIGDENLDRAPVNINELGFVVIAEIASREEVRVSRIS